MCHHPAIGFVSSKQPLPPLGFVAQIQLAFKTNWVRSVKPSPGPQIQLMRHFRRIGLP
jgi:hypothetical protein